MAKACTCTKCGECGGTGEVWVSFIDGEYRGRFRCDDLDELDICPDCDGDGITEMCEGCMEEEE